MTGISPLCSTSFGNISSPLALCLLLLDPLHGPLAEVGGSARQHSSGPSASTTAPASSSAELGHRLAVGADAGRGHVLRAGGDQALGPGRPP